MSALRSQLDNTYGTWKTGKLIKTEEALELPQIFKVISDHLLDGMPCDRAIQIVTQEPNEVVWKKVLCIHSRYWEAVEGKVQNYYQLRNKWLEGFAKALDVAFQVVDQDTYKLSREA